MRTDKNNLKPAAPGAVASAHGPATADHQTILQSIPSDLLDLLALCRKLIDARVALYERSLESNYRLATIHSLFEAIYRTAAELSTLVSDTVMEKYLFPAASDETDNQKTE